MLPELKTNLFYDLFDFDRFYFAESDVFETENEFNISIDLPGIEKDKIKLKWEGNALKVEALRENTRYRRYGDFRKVYHFNSSVDKDVDASFKNGVLDIVVKKEKAKESLISIK